MVSESECLICQLSTSRWAVQVTANFPHVRRLWDCQSLLRSHWERERDSPGKERQAPTCSPSSLRLAGFCRQHLYSQWSLFPTWGYTFQIPVSLTSLMTEATPFPRLLTGSVAGATEKVTAGPRTDSSDRTETKRPTAWRHHSALNSQSWAICSHLVWAPEGGWTQVI